MTLVHRVVGKRKFEDFDAFPKVPDDYKTPTATGGTVSIVSYVILLILVISEFSFYQSLDVKFTYAVDTDIDSKLKINIDITVAMPCSVVGADIIDSTNQNNAYTYGRLEEEPTYFELSPAQKEHWNTIRELNSYLRTDYHNIHEFLWKKDMRQQQLFGRDLPPREIERDDPPDSCRLHGTLIVNKVAGNFHITIGKHIPLPIGHAHISLFMGHQNYNFSHRIEKFAFGDYIPAIINPLEGEEKIGSTGKELFQYYLKVVSTDVQTSDLKVKTYQYSTTEKERIIDHDQGSHGMPGLYFKYEIDPIAVKIRDDDSMPFWKFLIRLCAIVGGVFATSGLINTIATAVTDLVTCRYLEKIRTHKAPIIT